MKKNPFMAEAAVWLKAAGIPAGGADGAAFAAHQRTDAESVKAYGEAEEAATEATTAITVEAVFTPALQPLRHTVWCAAFVVYMQRRHANLLPAMLKPKDEAASWEQVVAEAAAARTGSG